MKRVMLRGPRPAPVVPQNAPSPTARRSRFRPGPNTPLAGRQPLVLPVSEYYPDGDVLGVAITRAFDRQYGADLAGNLDPAGRRSGMKGSPNNSFRGDLGPLQYLDPVATGKASRGVRSGMGSANTLPGTTGPTVTSRTVQNMLGPGPL